MLNEEQQAAAVTITGGAAVVALQVITRLVGMGGLKDIELAPVGTQRDVIVKALQEATGVNYDLERARAEAVQRQRIAEARAQHEKAQQEAATAAETGAEEEGESDGESEESPAEVAADNGGNGADPASQAAS